MKISKFGNGRLFRRAARQVWIGQLAGYSQRAVLNLKLFGPGADAAISLSLLISFFLQAAHFGASKGVI